MKIYIYIFSYKDTRIANNEIKKQMGIKKNEFRLVKKEIAKDSEEKEKNESKTKRNEKR